MSCDHDMALGTCPECDDFKNWPGLVSEADPPGTSSMSDHGPNFNPPRSETVSPRTGPVGTLDLAEIRDRMKAHGQLSVATSDGVIEVKGTVTKRDSADAIPPCAAVSLSSGEVLWRLQNAMSKLTAATGMGQLEGLQVAYSLVAELAEKRRERDQKTCGSSESSATQTAAGASSATTSGASPKGSTAAATGTHRVFRVVTAVFATLAHSARTRRARSWGRLR